MEEKNIPRAPEIGKNSANNKGQKSCIRHINKRFTF